MGLAARALVYALIAGLMARAAFFHGNEDGVSPEEAFNWLEGSWPGVLLLAALSSGLFAYAGWRLAQGILDTADEGKDAKGWVARLGMIASGIGYGLLGVGAVGVLAGPNNGEGDDATQSAVQWLLQQPFGRWLIIAMGLVVAGIGCVQIWRAVEGKWKDGIDMSGGAHKLIPVIVFGIAARGLLFLVIAMFVLLAGWQASPDQAKGLSETITWLRNQPYGLILYLGAGLALGGLCRLFRRRGATHAAQRSKGFYAKGPRALGRSRARDCRRSNPARRRDWPLGDVEFKAQTEHCLSCAHAQNLLQQAYSRTVTPFSVSS